MMKKYPLIAVALLLLTCNIAAQETLRKSVCIVTPLYEEADKPQMLSLSLWFSKHQFRSEANMLAAYRRGTFGSGFVYQADNQLFVITNRHVVGYATQADIEFQVGRNSIRYDSCAVVSISNDFDLAAILLPSDADVLPLSLENRQVEEGEEVTTAGYPALAGKPSWQFGKGNVSNAMLYDTELTDENHYIVQHTAPIDGGSSGGPLLSSDNRVLGVNTWKAGERENVGLAIPAPYIKEFVASIASTDNRNAIWQTVMHLSTDELDRRFESVPDSVMQQIRESSTELLEPIERISAYVEAHPKQAKKRSAASSRGVGAQYDIHSNFGLSYSFSSPALHVHTAELYYSYIIHKYGIIGVDLRMNAVRAYYDEEIAGFYEEPYDVQAGISGGPHAGVQLPCRVGKAVYITPRAVYHYGIGTIETDKIQHLHIVRAGSDFSFGNRNLFTLGVYYQYMHATASYFNPHDLHGISVSLGFGM